MWVVRISAVGADASTALDVLLATGASELELDGDDALGLFPGHPDAGIVDRTAALLRRHGLDLALTVEAAEMLDWSSVWKAKLRPIRVGPLTIAPEGAAGDLVLAGGAFGTGLHPTTALCLDRLAARLPTGPVLDVGTGNGILALTALALGAPTAVGVDTDPDACRIAAQNAAQNGLLDRFSVRDDLPDATFPLVLANLLGATVRELVDPLTRRVAPGGELVLSGFTHAQAPEIARVWRDRGMRIVGDGHRDSWARLDVAVPW